ncbi:MAG: hypothetical protein ACOZE7_07150 [Pseudomonadota bacterium]
MDEQTQDAINRAVDLLLPAAAAEGSATSALVRAKGGTWTALKKAAKKFRKPITEAVRNMLSSTLAKAYRSHYGTKAAARSAASQHAKAITGLSRGLGNLEAVSLKAYLRSAFPPVPREDRNREPQSMRRLNPTAEKAIERLVGLAQRDPAVSDALVFMANHSDKLDSFVEFVLSTRHVPVVKLVK